MATDRDQHVTLTLARGYEFIADFPDLPEPTSIRLDEPAPLGADRGPNAAAMLGAAVGNCLAASLTFCLRKARASIDGMTAHVTTHVTRTDAGKFRINGIDVELVPSVDDADAAKLDRCDRLFEDFCIVTASVRRGIDVNVTVKRSAAVPAPR
jgi:uncharacterized OsmC-like protein